MFYIVETEEKVNELFSSVGDNDKIFLDVISYHDYYHPVLQDICCLYLRPLKGHKGYIIPINHSEALQVNLDLIKSKIGSLPDDSIFTRNLKFMKYFIRDIKAFDVMYYSAINAKEINLDYTETKLKTNFYRKHKEKDANYYIPITKLYEEKEEQYSVLVPIINQMMKDINTVSFEYFRNVSFASSELFYKIESNGIKLDKSVFKEHFSKSCIPMYSISKSRIYSSYSLYNYTGRPSNSFNGINFLALSKDNGERGAIIPSNHLLMDLDFSSYHLYLIANMIKYDFGDETDIHTHLGKIYFGKEQLSKEEYEKSKQITFSNIYGGVRKEYQKLPFFIALNQYITEIFSELQEKGEYLFVITKRIYKLEHFNSVNATKFFNYLLQGLESYVNLYVLKEFFSILDGKKSKIILYLYDSFLFDLDLREKDEIVSLIEKFLKNKIAFKVKYGSNYNELS